ncbi:MAG: hypothetical protein WDO15_11740 [Bacteroidota bacterium]
MKIIDVYTWSGTSKLWKSDGTTGGTTLVKDINPGFESSEINFMNIRSGKLYFMAYTREAGNELWTSDGTAEGTHIVKRSSSG